MELYKIILDLIDLRSFSNLWYWIGLAVLWSISSHWVLGVPFDMLARAKRHGGQMAEDARLLARINSRRLLAMTETAALPLSFIVTFFFTMLGILGFWYNIEFAQALFLLTIWHLPVAYFSLRTARHVLAEAEDKAADPGQLFARMIALRRLTQVIGMVAIFVTSLYGMWRNMSHSILF